MSYTSDAFRPGDRVYITADHLISKGKTGTVVKWHHDNIYTVDIDNGWSALAGSRPAVIKDNEMVKIRGRG